VLFVIPEELILSEEKATVEQKARIMAGENY